LILVVYLLGAGMAANGPPFLTEPPAGPTRLLGGWLALLPVAVTVHWANEYADADTDARTERTPFSGGSGALERTGLPASALGAPLAAGGVGSLGALAVGWVALSPLAAGILAAVLVLGVVYSLPPLALVRRGVGEALNVALGALLLPLYGAALLGTPTAAAGLAVLPFCAVVGCSLLATHWPDRAADAAVGKRTLVVRWSERGVRRAYASLATGAALAALALWVGGLFPTPVALAHLLAAPFLLVGVRRITRQRSPLPSVSAMVSLAAASAGAWWLVAA
jgi:1,4-dihydroxy-2-naphthoate octaprenyltransferase